jgi:D-arabinose 1-dehydrogenase-like Zn-dependent alcohol dehydrogenase
MVATRTAVRPITAVAPMKVAQVPKPGGEFQIVDREMPDPGPGHVRMKVQACGVCGSDALTKEGSWPGIQYPRVPGHEVVGVIDKLGAGVSVLGGTAVRTIRVPRADAAIFAIAAI